MIEYAAIIYDRDTSKILVDDGEKGLSLPIIQSKAIPCDGDKMSHAFRKELHGRINVWFDLVFLYSTINEADHRHIPPMYIAMFESTTSVTIDPEYYHIWLDITEIDPRRFPGLGEAKVLPYARRIEEECSENGVRLWEKPGWLQMTKDQATMSLRRLGYDVKPPFGQFSVTPNSAVLVVETDKGKVYLKASTKREAAITECISCLDPILARKPLHIDEEREWMLMEDYGQLLKGKMTGMDFENLMKMYGSFQRKAESQVQRLIDVGVPRVDPEKILQRVEKMLKDIFLSDDIENALRSAKNPEEIEKLDENTIRRHCGSAKMLLKHLYEEQKIPLTLCHGDLGSHNIIKSGTEKDAYIFIDWGEAHIDLPLYEMRCVRTHIVSEEERNEASEDSYLLHWSEYGSLDALEDIKRFVHLKNALVLFLEDYEYAVDKNVRPYLEENVLSRLCKVLKRMTEIVLELKEKS